jgi:hypothetical protein
MIFLPKLRLTLYPSCDNPNTQVHPGLSRHDGWTFLHVLGLSPSEIRHVTNSISCWQYSTEVELPFVHLSLASWSEILAMSQDLDPAILAEDLKGLKDALARFKCSNKIQRSKFGGNCEHHLKPRVAV